MMRLTWTTVVAMILSTPAVAQQTRTQTNPQGAAGQGAAAQKAPQQPFPPLSTAQQAKLDGVLTRWEAQSQATKTLDCSFTRWHYDLFAAPAGIHATRADGELKYAAPDKGLFRVDSLVFFNGMKEGKPQFKAQEGQYGEHWVCNGQALIEFDRSQKLCKVQELPPQMRGKAILNSPLPFVFNLDAKKIKERYWVRLTEAPKPGIILVEAWPKRQEDRAQYKLVQVALNEQTLMPQALLMYAPNFDQKTAPKWDHYEFSSVKRNAIGARFQQFLKHFNCTRGNTYVRS